MFDVICWRVKAMAPHSSTLAWKIPWMEEPGRLRCMGLWRVGHDWATSLSCIGEGNGNPLQCSCLENPRDGGAWWVAQSWTLLKRLSSSRNSASYFPSLGWFLLLYKGREQTRQSSKVFLFLLLVIQFHSLMFLKYKLLIPSSPNF